MKYAGYFKVVVEADNEDVAEKIVRGYRLVNDLKELEFIEVEALDEEGEEETKE